MCVITFFNQYQGLISSLIGFFTLIVAVVALNTWKQELKAKKLYELHYKAYKLLSNLKNELAEWRQFYKDMDEAFNPEDFNNQMAYFFKSNLETIEELALNLSQINEKDDTIQYFAKIFNYYSLKISDLNYGQIQTRINPNTGSIEDYDPFYKNLSADYFYLDENGKFGEMHNKINSKIDDGLKYFDDKIKNFFK